MRFIKYHWQDISILLFFGTLMGGGAIFAWIAMLAVWLDWLDWFRTTPYAIVTTAVLSLIAGNAIFFVPWYCFEVRGSYLPRVYNQ